LPRGRLHRGDAYLPAHPGRPAAGAVGRGDGHGRGADPLGGADPDRRRAGERQPGPGRPPGRAADGSAAAAGSLPGADFLLHPAPQAALGGPAGAGTVSWERGRRGGGRARWWIGFALLALVLPTASPPTLPAQAPHAPGSLPSPEEYLGYPL